MYPFKIKFKKPNNDHLISEMHSGMIMVWKKKHKCYLLVRYCSAVKKCNQLTNTSLGIRWVGNICCHDTGKGGVGAKVVWGHCAALIISLYSFFLEGEVSSRLLLFCCIFPSFSDTATIQIGAPPLPPSWPF